MLKKPMIVSIITSHSYIFEAGICSLVLTIDNLLVITGDKDGSIKIFTLENLAEVEHIQKAHESNLKNHLHWSNFFKKAYLPWQCHLMINTLSLVLRINQ